MNRTRLHFGAVAFTAFVFCLLTGCFTDVDDELSLMGTWVEESPVEKRTELYFFSGNRVTITTNGASDDFVYRIGEESIILRPDDDSEVGGTEFYFRQINENTFQIGNLHPSIPEEEATFMIFKRNGNSTDDI